ncbi:unnamed protein product [Owenia fusiformis]|uniref:PH domain-containing protein n=1 Tax=Owenia fusiformis TaxID=6347 RepID=A0A8S4NCJ1_OWEFU|nr:unnamed protein product [Owenia fusiformis]
MIVKQTGLTNMSKNSTAKSRVSAGSSKSRTSYGSAKSRISNSSAGSQYSGTMSSVGSSVPSNHSTVSSTRSGGNYTRDKNQAWWTGGGFLDPGTANSHIPPSYNNEVFDYVANDNEEEIWDLSDSLADLYASTVQVGQLSASQLIRFDRSDSDKRQWLESDPENGFVRIYAADSDFRKSQLVPCNISTTAHKISLRLGIPPNSLHVQFNGDIIKRVSPHQCPLVMQNEYLEGLGYTSLRRIQDEGASMELGYLIRFYTGKPFHDMTYARNQLSSFLFIRKGKVLPQWVRRFCVISGTRLLIYKDKSRDDSPTICQLAKGSVEEVSVKGQDLCLKVTTSIQGHQTVHLAFNDEAEFGKWLRKFKKATAKLPTTADLSNCHLESLPDTVFINEDLAMLNLRHNALRERPLEEDTYTIGYIDDLPKFTKLRSLNLADNDLKVFPSSICSLRTLVELNVASNKLCELPAEIGQLSNLQALHVHNNHLWQLPDEIMLLRKLFILVLAFNKFTSVPAVLAQMTDVRMSEIENIIMAGNLIETITEKILDKLKHVKKIDVRMNRLTLTSLETLRFGVLEHLTHLDIRDNEVEDLDLRSVKTLEYINCERNNMRCLQLSGISLKRIYASNNVLSEFSVKPKAEWLDYIDLSYNKLTTLPEWLGDCFFLQKLLASHNLISELPERIFIDARKLKSLRVNHNYIEELPENIDIHSIEDIHIQNNRITKLPADFLSKANKLRVFNATKNYIRNLPELNLNEDLNKVQELYLTGNQLSDNAFRVVCGYPRLKILHMAYNYINVISDMDVKKLEVLQELNISGNRLRDLPGSIAKLPKLTILRAHSNAIHALPDLSLTPALKVLDIASNQLYNISVQALMTSQINLLDMSNNRQLKVNKEEFKSLRNKKTVILIDTCSLNRTLPGLNKRLRGDMLTDRDLPWQVGFTETSGSRNRLCVTTVRKLKFRDSREALFAMFDGGHNNEVPELLSDQITSIMEREIEQSANGSDYMKYAMLSAHKSLKSSGQKLGASGLILHIGRNPGSDEYIMNVANTGDIEGILCKYGDPVTLTRLFKVTEDREECERICQADGIVTEDDKVNGTTVNSRLLGCAYLHPCVIPTPHQTSVTLNHLDEFLIIANKGLWKYVSYKEAIEEVYELTNPVGAAKKLLDLAQSYGSKENISVLVVKLDVNALCGNEKIADAGSYGSESYASRETLGSLISIDRSISSMFDAPSFSEARGMALEKELTDSMVIEQGNSASTFGSNSQENGFESTSTLVAESMDALPPYRERSMNALPLHHQNSEGTLVAGESMSTMGPDPNTEFYKAAVYIDGKQHQSPPTKPDTPSVPEIEVGDSVSIKPLPNRKFSKKNDGDLWEVILQNRLSRDVKDKEMRFSVGLTDLNSDSTESIQAIDISNFPDERVKFHDRNFSSISKERGLKLQVPKSKKSSSITPPPWDTRTANPVVANAAYYYVFNDNENKENTPLKDGSTDIFEKSRRTSDIDTDVMLDNGVDDTLVINPLYDWEEGPINVDPEQIGHNISHNNVHREHVEPLYEDVAGQQQSEVKTSKQNDEISPLQLHTQIGSENANVSALYAKVKKRKASPSLGKNEKSESIDYEIVPQTPPPVLQKRRSQSVDYETVEVINGVPMLDSSSSQSVIVTYDTVEPKSIRKLSNTDSQQSESSTSQSTQTERMSRASSSGSVMSEMSSVMGQYCVNMMDSDLSLAAQQGSSVSGVSVLPSKLAYQLYSQPSPPSRKSSISSNQAVESSEFTRKNSLQSRKSSMVSSSQVDVSKEFSRSNSKTSVHSRKSSITSTVPLAHTAESSEFPRNNSKTSLYSRKSSLSSVVPLAQAVESSELPRNNSNTSLGRHSRNSSKSSMQSDIPFNNNPPPLVRNSSITSDEFPPPLPAREYYGDTYNVDSLAPPYLNSDSDGESEYFTLQTCEVQVHMPDTPDDNTLIGREIEEPEGVESFNRTAIGKSMNYKTQREIINQPSEFQTVVLGYV